jgi:hypothetical protein
MSEGENFELIIIYKRGSVGIRAPVFIYYNKFKSLDHTPLRVKKNKKIKYRLYLNLILISLAVFQFYFKYFKIFKIILK